MRSAPRMLLMFAATVAGLTVPLPARSAAVPYAESFESYTNGTPAAQIADWSADAGTVVSTNAVAVTALAAYTNAGNAFPLATSHAKVLDLGTWATNAVASATGGVVVADVLVLGTPRDEPPATDAGVKLAVYAGTNGHLNVWHQNRTNAVVNEWRELTNSPVLATGQWARVSICQDHGAGMFRLFVNATNAVVDDAGWTSNNGARPGSWFYMVQTNTQAMAQFCAVNGGASYLDDLVVTNRSVSGGTNGFVESEANDGTIDNTTPMAIDLQWDAFAGTNGQNLAADAAMLSVSNLPAGLALSAVRTGPTRLSVTLTGQASPHEGANGTSNLTIRLLDGAFALGRAWDVTGATVSNVAVRFLSSAGTPALSYGSTVFAERAANDGGIAAPIVISVASKTLTGTNGQDFVASVAVAVTNLPAGLSATVVRDSAQQATLSLHGLAGVHDSGATVTNLTVTFLDAAFSGGGAAGVSNATVSNLQIIFHDPPVVTVAPPGFTEAAANNGSIAGTVTLTLTGDTFAASAVFTNGIHFSVAGVPEGLSVALSRSSSTQLVASLTGSAGAHAASNSTTLTLQLLDAAFQTVAASNISGASSVLGLTFLDPPVVEASPAGFTEAAANNGSIGNSVTLTLTGDTFTNAAFVPGVHYATSGVPAGLSVSVTRNSATQAVVSLTGTAAAHGSGDSTAFGLELLDAAFQTVAASNILGVSRTLNVTFADPPVMQFVPAGFTEAAANNGSIGNTVTVTLTGESFATNAVFSSGVHFSTSGVPAGLRVVITRSSATQAVVSLTGAAAAHTAAANTSFALSFLDAAFQSVAAADIQGSAAALSVTFADAPVLSYAPAVFTERGDDNGTMGNAVAVTLTGAAFAAGPLQAGVHYTVTGVPAGLTFGLLRGSDTLLTASLGGQALSHSNSNDTVIGLTFLDAAFQSVEAAGVVGVSTNLGVDFIQLPPANTVPFVDDFESYSDGLAVIGTNGWTGGAADAAVVSSDTGLVAGVASYASGYPLITTHSRVLRLAGDVTNLTRSSAGRVVFVDLMEYVTASEDGPGVGETDQMAFYVNTNQQAVVWHRDPVAGSNVWTVLGGSSVATQAWHRVTVYQDYGHAMFRIKVDDRALSDVAGWTGPGGTQPGSWFHMVQTNGFLSQAAWVGGSPSAPAHIDDVRISYDVPLSPGAVFKFR